MARAPELLEPEPTEEEVGKAEIVLAETHPVHIPAAGKPLPEPLDSDKLKSWGVPDQYHAALLLVRTEAELLGLGSSVPDAILERVLNGLWPRPIEEILQQPVRMTPEAVAMEAAADGIQSLDSFLLKLDDEQKDFVARFNGRSPKGPWLVKGGPGSGKSTVALYCIQSLIRNASLGHRHTGRCASIHDVHKVTCQCLASFIRSTRYPRRGAHR